jgi:peptidoglycan-associated lipoprotein
MKRVNILTGAVCALLLLSGCSQKQPESVPDLSTGQSLDSGSGVSKVDGSMSSETLGGVNSEGKYTGTDGVSASGIKLLYFATDQYRLDSDQIARIMSDLPKIRQLVSRGKIRVEGNCDEFGTDEYNHALGLKRAKSVKQVLVANGIDAGSIEIMSYGESNPVCTGNTPPCHAKNRRAEINSLKR